MQLSIAASEAEVDTYIFIYRSVISSFYFIIFYAEANFALVQWITERKLLFKAISSKEARGLNLECILFFLRHQI